MNYGYITALSEISFHVDQGEIITLIGSNGAGKTTSLHAISGLVHKAGGSVRFKGAPTSAGWHRTKSLRWVCATCRREERFFRRCRFMRT
ncbi:MAG: ATP-binding cassette domain-containing protein [Clostridium sp.]